MTFPTVHRNGTSKDELRRQLEKAVSSLTAALDALAGAAPNARDYYPQGDHGYAAAAREHASRLARLLTVRDELTATWEAIEAQP